MSLDEVFSWGLGGFAQGASQEPDPRRELAGGECGISPLCATVPCRGLRRVAPAPGLLWGGRVPGSSQCLQPRGCPWDAVWRELMLLAQGWKQKAAPGPSWRSCKHPWAAPSRARVCHGLEAVSCCCCCQGTAEGTVWGAQTFPSTVPEPVHPCASCAANLEGQPFAFCLWGALSALHLHLHSVSRTSVCLCAHPTSSKGRNLHFSLHFWRAEILEPLNHLTCPLLCCFCCIPFI